MNKSFRIISTILIVIGLIFLSLYLQFQNGDRLQVLAQPSYYLVQNFWYVFLAGICVIVFSVLGSYFSWFKQMEKKEEVLPNAGYATHEEINTWIAGTSADTAQVPAAGTPVRPAVSPTGTAVLPGSTAPTRPATAPLQSSVPDGPDKTAVLPGLTEALPTQTVPQPEKTEVLPAQPAPQPEKTEVLPAQPAPQPEKTEVLPAAPENKPEEEAK